MKFEILDSNFNPLLTLDAFTSIIWAKRTTEMGEFELYFNVYNSEYLDILIRGIQEYQANGVGQYLICDTFYDSEKDFGDLMFIQDITIKGQESEDESGQVTVTGKSLEHILTRRTLLEQKVFKQDVETKKRKTVKEAIVEILDENIINPKNQNRRIKNFVLRDTAGIWDTTEIKDSAYSPDEVYNVINTICKNYGFYYVIFFNFKNNTFVMELKEYMDRSYDQDKKSPIILSTDTNDLRNSSYILTGSNYKNVGIGVGEYGGRYYTAIAGDEDRSGLGRCELYVDASDVQRDVDGVPVLNLAETYPNAIRERAKEELEKCSITEAFESEINDLTSYRYGIDYNVGDIVEVANEYNIDSKVIVSEMVLSVSSDNISLVPTLVSPSELFNEEGNT